MVCFFLNFNDLFIFVNMVPMRVKILKCDTSHSYDSFSAIIFYILDFFFIIVFFFFIIGPYVRENFKRHFP